MKDERLYLGHIRDAISDIRAYASVGDEAFLADRMRQDAIIRKLEIIRPPAANRNRSCVVKTGQGTTVTMSVVQVD